MIYVYVPNFVLISLFCRLWHWKPQILPFFGLRHLGVSPVAGYLRKLNTGAQLQTFPIQRHQNRFCTPTPSWRNWVHKLWRSKAWWTNRQTKKNHRFWPHQQRVKSEPHQPWQGDRGPRARSCTSKALPGLTHSFANRGHWKFRGNQTPST